MQVFKTTGLAWLWLALIVLVLDQATKLAILANFKLYESIPVMPFFNLTYVQNFGAAFSFLANAGGWQRWFFTGIAILASVLISFWLYKTPKSQKLLGVGFSLILGGALGNLYDRISYGYVVDFIDWYVNQYHWPAFNIADAGIVIGAFLVVIDSFVNDEEKQAEQPKTKATSE
ncbi:signal peptidase II [Catenovulum sp. SM1970]|uniref:signal peptidase II n=1 Tax=Marinifaba aquimaris TaxID=2741323 RepID=UPI0015719DC2|nr:signal peptidase II [Marinifaba aquimaris]NTS76703.1 signal peptidase II [Marinifaba aquimaris]